MFVPLEEAQTWRLHKKHYKTWQNTSPSNSRLKNRTNSWRICLYIYHLSYPLFGTLFMEWLRFLGLIT